MKKKEQFRASGDLTFDEVREKMSEKYHGELRLTGYDYIPPANHEDGTEWVMEVTYDDNDVHNG